MNFQIQKYKYLITWLYILNFQDENLNNKILFYNLLPIIYWYFTVSW